jgi:hypothetical protein
MIEFGSDVLRRRPVLVGKVTVTSVGACKGNSDNVCQFYLMARADTTLPQV